MNITKENFKNFRLEEIEISNFIEKEKWDKSVQRLFELKFYIDEMLRIIESDDNISKILKDNTNAYVDRFIDLTKRLSEQSKGLGNEILNKKEQTVREIETWYRECLEKYNYNNNSGLSFLETFNTLKSLEKNNYENEFIEIKKIKDKIISDYNTVGIILNELQKKSSNVTMSDYADVFGTEANDHNTKSKLWLITGICLVALFLIILIFTDFYDKFPTEDLLSDGKTVKYNISNLLIKILMFAVQIFMISFSFKQFSINKHLSTVNKHRQNGLNSFKLFVESINKDDYQSRNSLMLQLAKAIYEQSTTGYIMDKNQGLNSGIVEITKMISANKLE